MGFGKGFEGINRACNGHFALAADRGSAECHACPLRERQGRDAVDACHPSCQSTMKVDLSTKCDFFPGPALMLPCGFVGHLDNHVGDIQQ